MSLERVSTPLALPLRPSAGHKGTFGHVLIVAGSRGMSGAAVLSARGALRGGAGLVTVAVPESIQHSVAIGEASYLTRGMPEDAEGSLSAQARGELERGLEKYDAVAIGPGWGGSRAVSELARWLYASCPVGLVVDADALNGLGGRGLPERENSAARIFTPHPGEFARLTGKSTAEVQGARERLAGEYAKEQGVVVLLKGEGTVITDGERVAINTTGNSGMGTGGCGDVLTGLIGALLGQRMEGFEAARLGAHLHGLAGDLAAEELSEPGLIASDLPNFLGKAWKRMGAR